MYNQKHIDLPRRFTGRNTENVAFFGDKVVATDSFRLIEMLAAGEHHEARMYPASLLKAVKIPKNCVISDESFGLQKAAGEFPKYEELKDRFEKQEYIEFSVNGDYIAELASQLGKLSKHKEVVFGIPKKWLIEEPHVTALPVRLKAPDVLAYCMPMRKSK